MPDFDTPIRVTEFGVGLSTVMSLRRDESSTEGDPALNVNFNLDPTNRVFNLNVGGQANSDARIHFGDAAAPDNPVTTLGNVGIGTIEPSAPLHVAGGPVRIDNQADGAEVLRLGTERRWLFRQLGSGAGTSLELVSIVNSTDVGNKNFIINTTGKVGIGTTTPEEKLHVDGSVFVTGDVILTGADCAEDFDVDAQEAIEGGMVMVIGDEERLRSCRDAYDRRVAGVLSGAGDCRPGVILGKRASADKRLPLALNGKVFCRVDASFGPVGVGDLLTTSPTRGHAMKATDPAQAFGAVIGKALRPLKEGCGLIPVLVSLQ